MNNPETPNGKVIKLNTADRTGIGTASNHRRKMFAEKSAFALFRLLSGVIVAETRKYLWNKRLDDTDDTEIPQI